MQTDNDPVNFIEWSARLAPGLDEVTNSNPTAVLLAENLVAVTTDTSTAQHVALAFERVIPPESSVTSVVYGHEKTASGTVGGAPSVDPEHVAGHAAKRSAIGAVPGALIGALVVGLGSFAMSRDAASAIGGAVGGALFGAAVAAVWSYVIGTGQSRAYETTNVDPETADVAIVAIHADDADVIRQAEKSVDGTEGVRLMRVDRHGETVGAQ